MQGAVEFFLGALSRIHAACGPLIEESLKGFCQVDVSLLSRVARTMLKSRTDSLCEASLSFSERLAKLADRRTNQVCSGRFHRSLCFTPIVRSLFVRQPPGSTEHTSHVLVKPQPIPLLCHAILLLASGGNVLGIDDVCAGKQMICVA